MSIGSLLYIFTTCTAPQPMFRPHTYTCAFLAAYSFCTILDMYHIFTQFIWGIVCPKKKLSFHLPNKFYMVVLDKVIHIFLSIDIGSTQLCISQLSILSHFLNS